MYARPAQPPTRKMVVGVARACASPVGSQALRWADSSKRLARDCVPDRADTRGVPEAKGAWPPRADEVQDVKAVRAELEEHGVILISGPADRDWGMRTLTFADPDGHIWGIAQDLDLASHLHCPQKLIDQPTWLPGSAPAALGHELVERVHPPPRPFFLRARRASVRARQCECADKPPCIASVGIRTLAVMPSLSIPTYQS